MDENETCFCCGTTGILGEGIVLCNVCYSYICRDCCKFDSLREEYKCTFCQEGYSSEGEMSVV